MAWPKGTEEFVFIISVRRAWIRSCPETLLKTRQRPFHRNDCDPTDLKKNTSPPPEWKAVPVAPHSSHPVPTSLPSRKVEKAGIFKFGGLRFDFL